MTEQANTADFLADGGEMGALMRAHDWSASGLGPTDQWPQSLRTVIRLMLNTGHPMYVFWGPEGCCFYNDAYRQSIGAERHPGSLGKPVREVWAEIWPIIGPQVEQVMSGGGATWNVNQLVPITRDGVLEDVYWTYSYSPIDDEGAANGIGGVLVVCSETTALIQAERSADQERLSQRRMMQQMPGFAALLSGPDHRYEYVNDAYVAVAGKRDYLGNTVRGLFPELEGQGFYELLDEVYATGRPYRAEGISADLAEDKGRRVIDLLYEPILDASGAVTGIFVGGYDVTQANETATRLATSELRYRTLFERVNTGFCIVRMVYDDQGKPIDYVFVEVNPTFEAQTGLTGDVIGKSMRDLSPTHEQFWFDAYGEVARTGEPARLESGSAGLGRWWDVHAYRVGEAEDNLVAVLFNDITERKALELRQSALIELDQELSRLTDPAAVVQVSSRLLAKALGAYRAGYGDVDAETETIIVADDWVEPGGQSVAGAHSFRTYGSYISETLQGRPVTIKTVATDPRTQPDPGPLLAYGIQALMDVPVMENGRMVAQVLVHSDTPRVWTEADIDMARAFAERTRSVVSRRKAEQETRAGELRQRVLLELNDALRDLTDPAEIEHASSRILADALGVSRVGYGVMDTVAETVTIARDYNAPGVQSIAGVIHFRDFGNYIENLARGETVIFADAASDPRVEDGGVALAGIRATSLINMPLIERGKVVALLFVNNATPREWPDEDVALVREVAERVRTASERARVETSLRESERRLRFLDSLAQATQPLTDADAVLAVTTRMTAEHLGVSSCAYADMDEDQDGFTIRGDWAAPGSTSIVGHYRLADFGVLAVQELGAGRPLIINDNLKEIAPEEAATFQAIGISATICMPLVKDGRLTALMAIHSATPHLWTAYEQALIREVTERSWAHIERVRAEIERSESESRYRTLFDTVDEGFCIIEFIDGPHGPLSDYRHVEANPAAADQVGLAGVAGLTIREIAPEEADTWVDLYRGVLETGEPVRVEQAFEATGRWLEVAAFRMEPASRNQIAVLFKDLTARRAGEVAVRESEARFRNMADNTPMMMWVTDPSGYCTYLNKTWYEFTGQTQAEAEGYGWLDATHPEDKARTEEAFITANAAQAPFRVEYRLRRADGAYRWAIDAASPRFDASGAYLGYVGSVIDIDDRREIETALRDSETRYRNLFESIDEGFCIIEFIDGPHGPLSDYVHVEANPAYTINAGIPDIVGKRLREIVGDEAEGWLQLYKGVLLTGESIRFERELEETGRWLELAAFRVEPAERNQVAVIFKDLTDKKRSEIALRQSEAEFRAFSQAVPNHVWASRPDGTLYWFNDQVYAYAGLSEGDIDGADGWGRIVHPDDLESAGAAWVRSLNTGERYQTEFRIRRADGAWRWFRVQAEPVRDAAGQINGWVGANSDIDDIRRQGEQLETLNDQLEILLEGSKAERDRLWTLSADMLARADYAGGLLAVNPAWTNILGWSEHELLTNPYADIINPDDLAATTASLTTMGQTGQSVRFENLILSKDGVWTPIGWTVAPEPDGIHFIAVGRDLTEDKAREKLLATAQEALRQSQKMEAVGQLTGGIAHDFNNLLAGISGSLELLSKRLSEGRLNGMERYIDAAQGSAQRAASLTQRLLAFSRRQTLDPKPTDVNRLINGMEDLIRRSVGPDVEVEVVGAGGLWPTHIDPSQLENALLNLCINARDAMAPDGGRLTIETSNKWLDDRAAKARDLAPGQYVSLCVTDTGTGMTPEIQAQAFDPFFTTKPLGQGTGLGLSMIHGFVRQSGGQVRIYSEMGKGTTLCLYLPRYQGDVEADEHVGATPVVEGGHGETVLIIDDEETVRMLVAEVLGEAGYNVIEAPDGPLGLEILRSDRRIDLLVSDVGLPGGMNGRQVADAARVTRPDLKVLFITGYAENAAVGNGLLAPGMEVLTKPFVMGDLAAKVHDMMES